MTEFAVPGSTELPVLARFSAAGVPGPLGCVVPGWVIAGVQVSCSGPGICHRCCASYRGRSTLR
jgi:hypothetical protein